MAKRGADESDLMMDDDPNQIGMELLAYIQSQDIDKVRVLIQGGAPAYFQENENGTSALMVAASTGNVPLIQLLLENGAPWNAIDRQGKCAGDYAVDGGSQEAIDTLVTAGVTAELLFGAIDRQSKKLQIEEKNVLSNNVIAATTESSSSSFSSSSSVPTNSSETYDAHFPAPPGQYLEDRGIRYDGDKLLDSADDAIMMEWETPLMEAHADILLGDNLHLFGDLFSSLSITLSPLVTTPLKDQGSGGGGGSNHLIPPIPSVNQINNTNNNDDKEDGVIVPAVVTHRRSVLNIGYGMGIIDNALQRRIPGHHTIIEAHPAVYQQMIDQGWNTKPNVTIIFGKWQDVIHNIGKFDSVFFDTYGERYSDMQHFHDTLPQILYPGGIYSFFNGMCPFNIFFHGVACELVKLELLSKGFETIYIPIQINLDESTWNGVTRKYWQRDIYYLPVSVFTSSNS